MRRIAFLIAVFSFAAAASPAAAQSAACAPRDQIVKELEADFNEAPRAVGLTTEGSLIELLSSHQGESWTLLLTLPNGLSCPVAAGEAWQDVPPRVAQRGPEL